MKKLMLLTGLLAFLLFSCEEPEADPIDEEGVVKKTFYAQNLINESFYQIEAGKLANGTHCTVWVERGAGISKETAQKVASDFDNKIYQKMINTFVANGSNFTDELADINKTQDGKLLILLLDIKDNYGATASAVGGYFLWSDLFPGESGSNGLAMIYIDTNPGKPGSEDSNKTLAHEMQHLINEITSQTLRLSGDQYSVMDTWIDEGLSTAAEYIYLGSHPQDRYGWYNNNGNGRGLINKGNNFFVWGNHEENAYAEIDDYATAYLFFQWLRIQKGTGIYKAIIGSSNADYRAVTSAAGNSNWGNLLRDWLAANYNASSGYGTDSTLKTMNKHLLTTSGTTPLYPGEGVFSKISSAYTAPSTSGNINYSLLTSSGISNQSSIDSGALLTYNVDTDSNSSYQNGTVTGVAASISADVSVDGRFVSPSFTLSGPFWVSAGDVLRRNGRAVSPAGVSRSSIRIVK
jgi:hypothetical protein